MAVSALDWTRGMYLADRFSYLFGHSYGGWTAIQTALHFKNEVEIGALVTLDPISPVQCKANELALDVLRVFTSPVGCLSLSG